MSENYCISVGLDYRTDGSDHEVEINYWDSDDNEARGIAKGENFEDAANHSFMNMLKNLFPQPEEEEEEESLDGYVAELESWLSEAEESRDALLDENARLERRILDLQKQVADFYKPCEFGPDPDFIKTEKPKYDKTLEYNTSTGPIKEKDSVEQMLNLLHKIGLC